MLTNIILHALFTNMCASRKTFFKSQKATQLSLKLKLKKQLKRAKPKPKPKPAPLRPWSSSSVSTLDWAKARRVSKFEQLSSKLELIAI